MSGPVDVLAWLDELCRDSEQGVCDYRGTDAYRVRAAVAELIAVVNRLANPDDGELLTLDDYRQIARAALANVGSAS